MLKEQQDGMSEFNDPSPSYKFLNHYRRTIYAVMLPLVYIYLHHCVDQAVGAPPPAGGEPGYPAGATPPPLQVIRM